MQWELKHRRRFKSRVKLKGKPVEELQAVLGDFARLKNGQEPYIERFQENHREFASLNPLWIINSSEYWVKRCRRELRRQGVDPVAVEGDVDESRIRELLADIKESLRSRGLLYTVDSLLGGFFGVFLEVRCLEFFLSWGRASRKKPMGALLKKLFAWFCRYFSGVVVPGGCSLERPVIMPYGDILDLVKRARVVTCRPCSCKSLFQPSDPEMPRDTCMGFQFIEDLEDLCSPNYRQEFELPPAVAAKLKECEEYGMIHQIMTVSRPSGRKGYVLCNCAPGSCVPLDLYLQYGIPMVRGTGAVVRVEEPDKCTSCRRCQERCIFGAADFTPAGLPLLHEEKCLGCGLCVTTCPAGLRKVDKFAVPGTIYQNIQSS